MKLERVEGTDEVREIPPTPFEPGIADIRRRSAAFRFIYYETGLYPDSRTW